MQEPCARVCLYEALSDCVVLRKHIIGKVSVGKSAAFLVVYMAWCSDVFGIFFVRPLSYLLSSINANVERASDTTHLLHLIFQEIHSPRQPI